MKDYLKKINSYIPGPLDGWLVGLATYFLSPAENRMRNIAIVGAVHFAVHEAICDHPAKNIL